MNVIKNIPISGDKPYINGFFKDTFYYFLSNKKLIKTDFELLEEINLQNTYMAITPWVNNCFIASKKKVYDCLYILNEQFEEIDTLTLCLPCCYKDEIISLNFDYKNCTILIGSKRNCITVNAKGCFISDELSKCTKSYFAKMSKSIVRDLDGCCRVTRDDKCCITAFGVFCDKYYLTYKINNKLYLAELFNGNLNTVYYIDCNIDVSNIISVYGNLQLIVIKDSLYNFIYSTSILCDDCQCYDSCKCVDDACLHLDDFSEVKKEIENSIRELELDINKKSCK